MFTVTSEAVYKEYAADGSEPYEYLAVAEWTAEYGPEGIPRNIRLEKEPGEKYGFTLEYKSKKHLAKSPGAGTPAYKADMREGDIVCVINGVDVTDMNHSTALSNATKHENYIEMTVVDSTAITLYERMSITITHELAVELAAWKPASKPAEPEPEPEAIIDHPIAAVAAIAAVVDHVQEEAEPEPEVEPEAEPEVEAEPEAEPESEPIIEHPVAVAAVVAAAVASKGSDDDFKPRLVTLKRDGGFGFFLQDNNGVHHLNQISKGEPADLAGVLENDRIVEINGTSVESVAHDQVVSMIRQSGDTVSFLVVDSATDEHYKAKGIVISSALLAMRGEEPEPEVEAEPTEVRTPPMARMVRFSKHAGTFGFEVHSETDTFGNTQYLRNIASDGPAHAAGVLEDDRILEINGNSAQNTPHEEVVDMIRASGNTITFLIADKDCSMYYHERVSTKPDVLLPVLLPVCTQLLIYSRT